MNKLVNKFCNLLMKSGNKARAYALFSESFTLFLKISGTRENTSGQGGDFFHSTAKTTYSSVKDQRKINLKNNQSLKAEPLLQEISWPRDKDSRKFLFEIRNKTSSRILNNNPSDLKKESKNNCTLQALPRKNNSGGASENILNVIVENVRPLIEIRKVRVARATYQVPAQISRLKGETLALRWIIESANKKKEKESISFAQALAFELASAYKKQGGPRQRRSELHKLAEANRSSIRYRWW